jgi:hypothetical protein
MELGKIILFFIFCLVCSFGFVVLLGFVCFKIKSARDEALARPGKELAALQKRIAYFERPRKYHEETWTVLGQVRHVNKYRILVESELHARRQLRERLRPDDPMCDHQCILIDELEEKLKACTGKE